MSVPELTEPVRQFIERHIPTLDHVAILLLVREQDGAALSPAVLAHRSRLERATVDRVVADLVGSRVLVQDAQGVGYGPSSDLGPIVDELAVIYRRMPVTLIRAIYAGAGRRP